MLDDRSNEPLAFVHVVPEGQREGGTTDIDGRFTLEVPATPVLLRFSYVGYKPTELVAQAGQPLLVRMERATFELRAVEVMPGENPAHRIIKQVHANRKANDGLRNRAHRYTSYSKTVFTAALDSAIINDPEKLAALDSSDQRAYD
ncbi:carboxypeptidase-like regulatory domain-containing protein, partial [Arthrospira platensis SPKY2]